MKFLKIFSHLNKVGSTTTACGGAWRRVRRFPEQFFALLCLVHRYEQLPCGEFCEILSFDRCQFYPKSDRTIYDLGRSNRWIVMIFEYIVKLLVLVIVVNLDRRSESMSK